MTPQIPFKKTNDGMIISVRVKPRSSKKGISGLMGETLKIKLTAPPEEGMANEQLIEVLSEALNIKKSRIKIIRGIASRNKLIKIDGAVPHAFLTVVK